MFLIRNCLGVEILDPELNFSSIFPGNDTTDAGLFAIVERNKRLPKQGYAANACIRGYKYREVIPGILLKKYEFNGNKGELNISRKSFIEIGTPVSEEEIQNGKLGDLIKKNKHKSIPLEEFGKYKIEKIVYEFEEIVYEFEDSAFDHINNKSCQAVFGIRKILKHGKMIKDESESSLAREIRIRISPERLTRIYPSSYIPYARCKTGEFCGFCYLLTHGMEKIDYIKLYMENNGIGTINYVFSPPFRSLQLEVRIKKSWLNK